MIIQDYKRALLSICNRHKFEVEYSYDIIIIRCPEMPSQDIQNNIKGIVPSNLTVTLRVCPKKRTVNALMMWFKDYEIVIGNDHTILINATSHRNISWELVKQIIKDDSYFKKCTIYVDGSLLPIDVSKDIIKNSKIRTTVISTDDVTNLVITMNTSKTLEEFLRKV